jgi:ABC-2 type transport system ATP-binding protein
MNHAASFDNVRKDYALGALGRRKLAAVRGVSLTIPRGSVFALLGPNRAGKTTLVKMLLSLSRPTAGTIQRLGQPIAERATLGRVGYMHENHAFPRYLSAVDVLHFYGGLSGLSSEELPGKVDRVIERVGLADRRHDTIAGYSKGMVQRLGLAQAILNEPDLLILDEPTEGLDLTGRKLLREVVRGMKSAGKTVLLVSHVLPEVEELCDEAAVVVGGSLAYRGSLRELSNGRPLETALQDVYERGAAA